MTEITRDLLLHLFHFDLEAGRLFWKSPPWNHPRLLGQEAGAFIPGHSGKRFRTAEEAHAAYLAKRKELFHDFA